ncbi:hypothetical protein ABGB21_07205 [Plantactinospora sp. B24E8]
MDLLVSERRWLSVRRFSAYGAALAMTPYLLIKISWVVGALLGLLPRAEQLSVSGFVFLNVVTIGMAAAGITLALALVRPWGERIPAVPLLACAWIGCGFLIPMIPYALLDSLLSADDGASGADAAVLPGWEASLIQLSFLGMGIGLAVALPLYLRGRWPAAFVGRVRPDAAAACQGQPHRSWPAVTAVVSTVALGAINLYWAAGGTLGLRHPSARILEWHLQAGNFGIWSVVGAGSVWVLLHARHAALPLWIPVSLGWLASGFLVAWSCWKLPFAFYLAVASPADTVWPEELAVAAVHNVLGVVAGTTVLTVLLRTYRARLDSRHSSIVGADRGTVA